MTVGEIVGVALDIYGLFQSNRRRAHPHRPRMCARGRGEAAGVNAQRCGHVVAGLIHIARGCMSG